MITRVCAFTVNVYRQVHVFIHVAAVRICMCMNVCVYVCMCVCVYVCLFVFVCMCVLCVLVCMCVCSCVCVFVCMCVIVRICDGDVFSVPTLVTCMVGLQIYYVLLSPLVVFIFLWNLKLGRQTAI